MSKAQPQERIYKKKDNKMTQSEVISALCDMHTAVRSLEKASRMTGIQGYWAVTDTPRHYRDKALQYSKRFCEAADLFSSKISLPPSEF